MNNKDIRQLQDDIIAILNNSDVLIEAKRCVLVNVLHLVEREADRIILTELRDTDRIIEEGELKKNEQST